MTDAPKPNLPNNNGADGNHKEFIEPLGGNGNAKLVANVGDDDPQEEGKDPNILLHFLRAKLGLPQGQDIKM